MTRMKLNFTTLDVFTTEKFLGNPVAVVLVPADSKNAIGEEQKQKIATEFNLSETVFLHEASNDDKVAEYDIFTSLKRITFAGHPTIGTALYIDQHARKLYPSVDSLHTLAGTIPLNFSSPSSGGGTLAIVQVPHNVRIHKKTLPHPLQASNSIPLVSIVKGMSWFFVAVDSLDSLGTFTQGVIPPGQVFSSQHFLDQEEGWNVGLTGTFYYRDLGIDPDASDGKKSRLIRTRMWGSREDPGTGSASSALCAYLSLLEESTKGKGPFEYHLVQGVEMGRRCDIFVTVTRTEDGTKIEKVELSGQAVKVMEGVIDI